MKHRRNKKNDLVEINPDLVVFPEVVIDCGGSLPKQTEPRKRKETRKSNGAPKARKKAEKLVTEGPHIVGEFIDDAKGKLPSGFKWPKKGRSGRTPKPKNGSRRQKP